MTLHVLVEWICIPRREADPLVVDLGNDGIQTTGVDKGLRFDLNGDNKLEQSSFKGMIIQ